MKLAKKILISHLTLFFFSFYILAVLSGCATIKGNNIVEQKEYVHDMKAETLSRLYDEYPIAKEQIKNSAGYGVFSNFNTHIFFLSSGSGYGVVTDNQNRNPVYMNMGTLGGGLGLGIKDFRCVIIFRKHEDLEKFIDEGWAFGGQADAAFKSGDKGGAYSAAKSADMDIITYQLTENGAALQATLQGTKYWKHKDLNL